LRRILAQALKVTSNLRWPILAQSRFAGPEWRETTEKKPNGSSERNSDSRGWDAQQLCRKRKADPEKFKIAQWLRTAPGVSSKRIAERLRMGAPAYPDNCLRVARQESYENMKMCAPDPFFLLAGAGFY
jgi:hypothetical protein